LGTVAVLVGMITPAFILTIVLTVAYTALAGSRAFSVVNLTLVPAALGVVIASTFRLGKEFFAPSVELVLVVSAAACVLLFNVNPTLVLLTGGLLGAALIRADHLR
jgi:chromate transport protein ChrA